MLIWLCLCSKIRAEAQWLMPLRTGVDFLAKTIPMIITNTEILVKDKESGEFNAFNMPSLNPLPNIPFYHQFAEKIAESQYYFKQFMIGMYGKRLSKYIFAIIVPDDTSKLESIFINEFFVNSDTCKAVAQMPMAQALSKEERYISVSCSHRNVIVKYIKKGSAIVTKMYDKNTCSVKKIKEDIKVFHIDLEYNAVPVYVNNFNHNMDRFEELGEMISSKQFIDKIANIDVEKL